jgi:opacity protein-like surface antigen
MADEPDLVTDYGMAVTVGGAYSNYVRKAAQDFTQPGGGWEARYVVGTRSHIAGEAAYTATLNGLDTLGVEKNAMLLGNGAEALLRANMFTDDWQPYLVAGVGWRHYNVANTQTNTSDVAENADAMTLPIIAGVSYRYQKVMADLRATYRPSFFDDIAASDDVTLDSASVGLNVGFEF